MNNLGPLERQLCDLQGRLFQISIDRGYNSKDFIEKFMNSNTVKGLDDTYDRLQWLGELYILEELKDECELIIDSNQCDREVIYWIGYIYRYWHYYKGVSSKEIYKCADYDLMNESYLMFHTMDPVMAIDDLIEISELKNRG